MRDNISRNVKHMMAIGAVTVFIAAVYYLPVETFLSFFAAGLFLIPTAFFVYMLQKVEGDNTKGSKDE